MIPARSTGTARPGRLLDRVAGVSVTLGLSMAAMPATGLAGRLSPTAGGHTLFAVLDLAQLDEALSRGELPIELLVAGSVAALAVGFALTLLVGTLRGRRRFARDPDPAAAESDDDLETRTTPPWLVADADAFQPAPPQSVDDEPPPFQRGAPNTPLGAAQAEAWAAREATIEVARQTSGWPSAAPRDVRLEETVATSQPVLRAAPAEAADATDTGAAAVGVEGADAPPTWKRTDLPLPSAAIASIESALASRPDIPPARSTLGTPEAPLVVELHDERQGTAGRRVGPNLPLVAVIGTVAVGVAFSAGAAVGATLGVGAGAAIGLAFAAGAGVAIGATVALLGGGRR